MSSTLQQFYPQSLCVECVLWGFGFAPPTVQENPIRFIEHSYLTMFVNVSVNGCVRDFPSSHPVCFYNFTVVS